MTGGLAAALLGAWAAAASAADDPGFLFPMNSADLPGRCLADRIVYDVRQGTPFGPDLEGDLRRYTDPGGGASDPDALAIGIMLVEDVRMNPFLSMQFVKSLDYYARREAVQKKFEARIEALRPERRPMALANYAMTLLYVGEYQKIVDFFGPKAAGAGEDEWGGTIHYALSQAYFRLGRYQESIPHSERAWKLLKHLIVRDTVWQNMMSQLGLYGEDFLDKYAFEGTTLEHVRKLFPNRDWSALPFEDVTEQMGLGPDRWGGAGSVSFVDLDGDGYDDLVAERFFMPYRIFKNLEGRAFQAIPDSDRGTDKCSGTLEFPIDYDNDGRTDLHRNCCNYHGPGPMHLLKNMGHMTFQDVTRGSGLELQHYGMAPCWGDYDLDGNVDYVYTDQLGPTRLYRNQGDGTFAEATRTAGIKTPGAIHVPPVNGRKTEWGAVGCTFGDFNDDRWPDLFVQGWGWKQLYFNQGDGTFVDATRKADIDPGKGKNGYLALSFDYNNDGRLDILAGQYVTIVDDQWGINQYCTCSNLLGPDGYSAREWAGAPTIYKNNGDGTFSNVYQRTKFLPLGVMGYAHGDWDNDGDQDVVMGAGGPYYQQAEPFLFYRNNGDGTFTNMTPFTMRRLWGKGHGIAFGDYDHDGQLDLMLNNGGFVPGDLWPSTLLHNKGGKNHWIRVSLNAGPGTNRSCIGARVRVFAGKTQQLQEVRSGGSFGVSSLTLHFGLGSRAKADRIVVEWPNRRMDKTVLRNVPADQAIAVSEGRKGYVPLWSARRKAQAPGN